jgi:hypothetical protein
MTVAGLVANVRTPNGGHDNWRAGSGGTGGWASLVVASRCGLLDDRHKLTAWTRWLTWRGPSDEIKTEGGSVVKMVRSTHWCWRSNRCGVQARERWSMGMGVAGLAAR